MKRKIRGIKLVAERRGDEIFIKSDLPDGDIITRNVTGSFTVESDGSGGIFATDIRGSVVVEHDGSGEINASRVAASLS